MGRVDSSSASEIMSLFTAIPIVAGSSLLFSVLNSLVATLRLPAASKDVNFKAWDWRNTWVSFLHSSITAIWSVLCFVYEPRMLKDMIDTKTNSSYLLLAVSTGYFIHDFRDIFMYDRFRQWTLLLHHVVVISAFSVVLTTSRFLGYGACSLLMEVNSIFLHSRRLLRMAGVRSCILVKINSVCLLVTFICFRLVTSGWMVNWLHCNRRNIPTVPLIVGSVGMIILCAMNIGLLVKLWNKEVKKRVHPEKIS